MKKCWMPTLIIFSRLFITTAWRNRKYLHPKLLMIIAIMNLNLNNYSKSEDRLFFIQIIKISNKTVGQLHIFSEKQQRIAVWLSNYKIFPRMWFFFVKSRHVSCPLWPRERTLDHASTRSPNENLLTFGAGKIVK